MKKTEVTCLMCGRTTIYPVIQLEQPDGTILAKHGIECFPICCIAGKIKEENEKDV